MQHDNTGSSHAELRGSIEAPTPSNQSSSGDRPTQFAVAAAAAALGAPGHGRSRLKVWLAVGALIAVVVLGLGSFYLYQTTGSLFGLGQSAVLSASLTGSDLPSGWSRCPQSGRVQNIVQSAKVSWVSDTWTRLQANGATDAELVIYTKHPGLCSQFFSSPKLSFSGSNNDSTPLALSLVAEFKTVTDAVAELQSDARNCSQLAECSSGMTLGLGPHSEVICAKASCGGTVAEWQRNALLLSFLSNLTDSDAKKALGAMDARAQRIAPPAAAQNSTAR